jgi:hypothetical protein
MQAFLNMLHYVKLTRVFWGEAILIAIYLQNRQPSKVVDNLSPYELWIRHKPNVFHLRVFGCIAFVLIPRKNSKKLDYNSKECTFLRYNEENKGFRLMTKSNKFVLISRDGN